MDDSQTITTCPTCQAIWINDQHVWSTKCKDGEPGCLAGHKIGNELDLKSLVCDRVLTDGKNRPCGNPLVTGRRTYVQGMRGETWEDRMNYLEKQEGFMQEREQVSEKPGGMDYLKAAREILSDLGLQDD